MPSQVSCHLIAPPQSKLYFLVSRGNISFVSKTQFYHHHQNKKRVLLYCLGLNEYSSILTFFRLSFGNGSVEALPFSTMLIFLRSQNVYTSKPHLGYFYWNRILWAEHRCFDQFSQFVKILVCPTTELFSPTSLRHHHHFYCC